MLEMIAAKGNPRKSRVKRPERITTNCHMSEDLSENQEDSFK